LIDNYQNPSFPSPVLPQTVVKVPFNLTTKMSDVPMPSAGASAATENSQPIPPPLPPPPTPPAPPAPVTQVVENADQYVSRILNDRNRKATVKTPDTFDGKERDTEKTTAWLRAIEKNMILTAISDNITVIYASQFLTEKALDWYDTILDEQLKAVGSHWDAFKTEFHQRFDEINHRRKLLTRFLDITQDTSASRTTSGYNEEFVTLWGYLKGEISEPVALERYIQGLRPRTRVDVLRYDPETLSDAMRFADGAEAINVQFFRRNHRGNNSYRGASQQYAGEPMDLSSMRGSSQQNTRPHTNTQSDTQKQERRRQDLCYKCGEKGHYARSCPKRRRNAGKDRA
jgi:hypothetical protein